MRRRLRPLWETLLVNQFHDILPGSCIPEAHDESLRQTTALLEEAGAGWMQSFGRSRWAACSIRWVLRGRIPFICP